MDIIVDSVDVAPVGATLIWTHLLPPLRKTRMASRDRQEVGTSN